MTIPKYHQFMKPILELLSDNQEYSRKILYQNMAQWAKLTDEELQQWLPSGHQLVYINRISWALTYLKKANLIESPGRATFRIAVDGEKVLRENPPRIDANYLKQFAAFNDFNQQTLVATSAAEAAAEPSDETPQDLMDRSHQTLTVALADELLSEILNQSSDFFEKLVVDLLVAMGYGGSKIENSQVLGKSGDEGIDGIIKEDKLGFDKIYIQAKRWDIPNTVGRPEIQKFVGALTGQGATKGAFITTASFSKEAREFVSKANSFKIVLIDGRDLARLMIEHNLGVAIENTYYIKRVDTDYFNEV